jgi:hypothetical protein
LPDRILHGLQEPIFDVLPESVLANFQTPHSENALVWNLIYPLARPTISFQQLMQLRPLWGVVAQPGFEDAIYPYFWGYDVKGDRLPKLDEVLENIDGEGPRTEVDLFLLGQRTLIVAEAKHLSALGHCSRYAARRCPEIHSDSNLQEQTCRYWELPQASFSRELDFGERPQPDGDPPPCNRHYQLARTLLVGRALSEALERELYLWMLIPEKRWSSVERSWLDFSERVMDDGLWRRMRVLAWEALDRPSTTGSALLSR